MCIEKSLHEQYTDTKNGSKFLLADDIDTYLERYRDQGLLRSLKNEKYDKKRYLNFSSNDYLALSSDVEALNYGFQAALHYGTGSTGSRLLSGNHDIFYEFEKTIAKNKQTESALIFNSGYIANLSVISAFSALGYQLIFDKLNHASMYQGADLKTLKRFKHLNYEQLEDILKNTPGKKVIASETVFGMDGDKADVEQLIRLSEQYDAVLYLDEAHATGLYGKDGYGLSTDYQFDSERTVIMGTFSKALASSGAYVACSAKFKEFLIQVSKGFTYSTALSPFCIAVAWYNWDRMPSSIWEFRRNFLQDTAKFLRIELRNAGIKFVGRDTNIVAITYDDVDEMLKDHEKLLQNDIITSAIRRPTSPTPRIRIAVNAAHTYTQVSRIAEILKK